MKKTKTQKGITLIALIITIVVLLILAVVAIDAIQDDGGILAHAQNAATTYNQAVTNEQVALDKYLEYLTGVNGGFEVYEIGDEVKVKDKNGNEHAFYVIKDGGNTQGRVTLLAKNSINTNTLTQSNANPIDFSETDYWADAEGNVLAKYERKEYTGRWNDEYVAYDLIETEVPATNHYAAYAAYQYGNQFEGGTGRLLTFSETFPLWYDEDIMRKVFDNNGNYWIGAAGSRNRNMVYV